jgi:hypothetical protein
MRAAQDQVGRSGGRQDADAQQHGGALPHGKESATLVFKESPTVKV